MSLKRISRWDRRGSFDVDFIFLYRKVAQSIFYYDFFLYLVWQHKEIFLSVFHRKFPGEWIAAME